MVRQKIPEYIKRRLYAESIGRCMNPKCQRELLRNNGDIFESAHIISYSETKDNSFDNLVILCPNCHTDYDKNKAFTSEELRSWKTIREKEIKRIFGKKYENFEDMQNAVTPLLYENKLIYEKYYLGNNKILWDKMENKLLINNRKIKEIFINNFHLIQRHNEDSYSNLHYVNEFLLHVEEFESTRQEKEKMRGVFFQKKYYLYLALIQLMILYLHVQNL